MKNVQHAEMQTTLPSNKIVLMMSLFYQNVTATMS